MLKFLALSALVALTCLACGSSPTPRAATDAAVADSSSTTRDAGPTMRGCWRDETFGIAGDSTGGALAAALDETGVLHVAYTTLSDTEGYVARYATRDASATWNLETLGVASRGADIALALSPIGTPYVAYISPTPRVVIATRDAGAWTNDAIADAHDTSDLELATDATGALHLAYQPPPPRLDDPTLSYGTRAAAAGSAWTLEPVPDVLRAYDILMAVASDGTVHISYGGTFTSWHAERVAGAWTTTSLDDLAVPRDALAVDATGTEHALGATPLEHWSRAPAPAAAWALRGIVDPDGQKPVLTWAGDIGYASYEIDRPDLEDSDLMYARYRDGAWEAVEWGHAFIPDRRVVAANAAGASWVVTTSRASEWTCP